MLSEESDWGGGCGVWGLMSLSIQPKIYGTELDSDQDSGDSDCLNERADIQTPARSNPSSWAPVWMDGQHLTFRLETEKELIFWHLDWTVVVISCHWILLFEDFISHNVSGTFRRSDKTWSVTEELLMGAKVRIPPSCSQQEPVWHAPWLIREVWDSDSFSMSRIWECLEGTSGTGGHGQASASHLAHSPQLDHLGRDIQFKSPPEASRAGFVSAQASRLS